MSLLKNSFLQWVSSSLFGHMVFFALLGIPLAVGFLSLNKDMLTVPGVLRVAAGWGLWGVIVGAGFWYTFSLPLKRRRNDR